ncbi:MAG: hypothetical protein HQM14_21385 [SAR324 cluster bacterium]|nr:hypothetical protein [SAR324 cluster bacterium]
MQTVFTHGQQMNNAYKALLGKLPNKKKGILKRSFNQILNQHQQIEVFMRGTM